MKLFNDYKTIYEKDGVFYASKTNLTQGGDPITFIGWDLDNDEEVEITKEIYNKIRNIYEEQGILVGTLTSEETKSRIAITASNQFGVPVFSCLMYPDPAIVAELMYSTTLTFHTNNEELEGKEIRLYPAVYYNADGKRDKTLIFNEYGYSGIGAGIIENGQCTILTEVHYSEDGEHLSEPRFIPLKLSPNYYEINIYDVDTNKSIYEGLNSTWDTIDAHLADKANYHSVNDPRVIKVDFTLEEVELDLDLDTIVEGRVLKAVE